MGTACTATQPETWEQNRKRTGYLLLVSGAIRGPRGLHSSNVQPLVLLDVGAFAHSEVHCPINRPNLALLSVSEPSRKHAGRTYENHGARSIDDVEQRPPVGLELAPLALERDKLVARHRAEPALELGPEPLRREVEPDGDEGEEPECPDLGAHARQRQILALLQLARGVAVGRLRSRDDDGSDELEEEGKNVEPDEDGSEPPGCVVVVSQSVL